MLDRKGYLKYFAIIKQQSFQSCRNIIQINCQYFLTGILPMNTKLTVGILLFSVFLFLTSAQQTNNLQISTCLGNCIYCNYSQPSICLSQYYNQSNFIACLPFYSGQNCSSQTFAYQNVLSSGSAFSGWSAGQPSTFQIVQQTSTGQLAAISNNTYSSLGPLTATQNLYKAFSFGNSLPTNRLVAKLSLTIDDASIQNYFLQLQNSTSASSTSSSTQNQTQILPNGTKIITIVTTTTTNNNSIGSSFSGRSFMYADLIDPNTSAVLQRQTLSYDILSKVRTSAGYLYTYLLRFDLSKQYSMLALKFSFINSSSSNSVQWSLADFELSLGCNGFSVSSYAPGSYNCDQCLSGFYPVNSVINGEVQQCLVCDYRCATCISSTTCLTCVSNTVYNPASGMCEYSQFFKTLNGSSIVIGQLVQTGGQLPGQTIRSSGGFLIIQQPLINSQQYSISFDLLYSALLRNSGQTLSVVINNQTFSFNSLELSLDVGTTILGISPSSNIIYRTRKTFVITGGQGSSTGAVSNLNSSTNIRVQLSNPTGTQQEIAIANLKVVQFLCSQNCLSCTYNQYTQTSQCQKCSNFFQLQANCLNCANGFYLDKTGQQCIKCYSTCMECSGPEIKDCISCFSGFQLGDLIYDYKCINCLYEYQNQNSSQNISVCQASCLQGQNINALSKNINCQKCFSQNQSNINQSTECTNCWLQQNLAKSSCEPNPALGYQFYGNDLSQGIISSQWTSNMPLVLKNLSSFYTNLYGVDYQTTSQNQTTMLTFIQPFLPVHRGITIFFNIFKVNTWYQGAGILGASNSQSINILISSQNTIVGSQIINVNNSYGDEFYGGSNSGNQMIYTFAGNYPGHIATGPLNITVIASHTGVFLEDLQVYLGNCALCSGNKLTFQIYYIPMYSSNSTQTGLDVWLTFNQGVTFVANNQQTQNQILQSFQFSLDAQNYTQLLPFIVTDNRLNQWSYVKYFLPFNCSYVNATLRVNNSMGYNIYSRVSKQNAYLTNPIVSHRNLLQNSYQIDSNAHAHALRLLLNERLQSSNVYEQINRCEDLSLDYRSSMAQIDDFFNFFQWFTLFTMIVFAFLGLGVIFQQFSILIQLLFLHIYVTTNFLPATFKQPLSHMQKMQNLNFFAYQHARSIENGWFSNVQQQSPYPLTQYNIDVYFARSFYPIIIINLIFLFWFLVLFICLKCINKFKQSPNKFVKFFRDIPQRPMNYFDQIWRYQFITTMWASFIQFYYFSGPTAEMRLNLALCIASFIISLVWPVVVMIYTYHQHLVINVEHFLYLYNDIYYRRISSIADKTSYYMYIAVRFGRYFFFALFIAVFVFQAVIGPVILLAATILQIIYIFNFSIFRDKIYLTFKCIQNVGFIILEILLLIIYGFSDDSISPDGFISLGYGLDALYILMIINGIVRFLYLGYKRIREFIDGRYDYGEKGELHNYDRKNPTAIQLPPTERGLMA